MLGTVVIGVIFTDIKGFPTGAYVPEGRNLGRVEFIHGGVTRNIAEDIAVSGMPVTFVSMTEDSPLGKDAVERLAKCGVNTEFVLPVKENGIGKWLVILNSEGDVAGQISCPPDMKPLEKFVDAYGKSFVKSAGSVILEMDIGEEISEKVLDLAEHYHKPVYTIVGNMSVLSRRPDFIRRTACFICNELEIGKLTDRATSSLSPAQMLTLLSEEVPARDFPSVIVTMGAKGCVFLDKATGESGWLPAKEVDVVDTSGAGDAFLSGTVMGFNKGLSLREAAGIGIELAALTISSRESSCPVNTVPADYCKKKAAATV